jgi:hypothetical protein
MLSAANNPEKTRELQMLSIQDMTEAKVSELFRAGATIDNASSFTAEAFCCAVRHDKVAVVTLFLDHGFLPNTRSYSTDPAPAVVTLEQRARALRSGKTIVQSPLRFVWQRWPEVQL